VQRAWAVVPSYLNEWATAGSRAVWPALACQIGHCMAASDGLVQSHIAVVHGGNYSLALALIAPIVIVVIVICAMLECESRGTDFAYSP